ncbi:MAG TPA: prolipoprotein diacylglyceryl transferase [Blastocatellia bacterium]|nr:prolipoprotein diacylglyceryl transferase [Blastocatellia bacterium]
MLPELFRIPFTDTMLPTYGLLLAIAFITALWIIARLAERDGLPKNNVYDLGLYVLGSGLIGSKLLMVVTEWDDFKRDWSKLISLDFLRSGGVYFGGFLVAVGVSILLVRKWKLPWLKTADAFAPGVALGHFIGRLGCFSAGCCWGKHTSSWLAVTFSERATEVTGVPAGVPLVPTQLIEAGANLLIFAALIWMRGRRRYSGQIMFFYLLLYSAVRFTIEFWRDDPRGEIMGLSTSQFISALIFPLALGLMVYYRHKTSGKIAGQTQTQTAPDDEHEDAILVAAGSGEPGKAEGV